MIIFQKQRKLIETVRNKAKRQKTNCPLLIYEGETKNGKSCNVKIQHPYSDEEITTHSRKHIVE